MESLHDKALDLLKARKLESALKCFNEAIAQEPDNATIISDRGVLYYHLNEKMLALADMNKSVELEPRYAYRYSSRAYIKDWIGDTAGAVEDYEIAVKLDPEDAVAYNNLGLMQEKLGYKQKAEENFKKADKLATIEKEMMARLDRIEAKEKVKGTNGQGGKKINGKPKEMADQTKNETPDAAEGRRDIIKKTLTKRKSFKEFLSFIKNGFKLRD